MTELEAEAWAARLERVWSPESVRTCTKNKQDVLKWDAQIEGPVFVEIELYDDSPDVHLYYDGNSKRFVANLYLFEGEVEADKGTAAPNDVERREIIEQFAPRWTAFFRRSCWLSGFDIEASAHEKAEWLQGFNHEEIKAWNLEL